MLGVSTMAKRSVAHIEIPAPPDKYEKSAKFFKDAFGWDYQIAPTRGQESMSYGMFETANKITGGYSYLDNKMNKAGDVLVYISSDDIEADLKNIEKLGGKKLSDKMVIPGFGELAQFTDPNVNRLCLWNDTSGR